MPKEVTLAQRFEGCIIGGAIGDAMGSAFENQEEAPDDVYYPFGKPEEPPLQWQITDDTQLTLATIAAIAEDEKASPETVARHFVELYRQKKLRGLGASTLKALRELDAGNHWSQAGRKGERAAGNGAAMRIAPLAFCKNLTSEQIRTISNITHHNDEAYIGAKCVVIAIQAILNAHWNGQENLLEIIIPKIPDTSVRDRLIQIKDFTNLQEIGRFGNTGYVVDSVTLALAAANQVSRLGIANMYDQLIEIGGDVDTNCSIAGQVAGALLGIAGIPGHLQEKLKSLNDYPWIKETIEAFKRQHC